MFLSRSNRFARRHLPPSSTNTPAITSTILDLQHRTHRRCSFHDKVLVANRGEIACRVMRTCQRLKIPTVALYSVADTGALHVRMAQEAYQVGTGPAPTDSYLRQDEILDIALRSGAQAIHPGYGFLSENADFCQKVTEAGLVLIGPPASAMTAMGSKQTAKAIMEAAGVPCTPGYAGENQSSDTLRQRALEMGYPVLIKAWHGGGGKGMRLVWSDADFEASLQACQREALAAFGDSNVLLEKYLTNPRHIEVQVVADSYGNAVHLYERDCSLQRRHQKIIEEAPASDLDPQLRWELGEMGKRAAQAVGYVNAGTVEFLLSDNQFYFCEMNTRLQVEHPITEQITGIDLVEWQLRIAAGEPLPLRQDEISCVGHAMEARIYAENPARGFLPATGTVWHHRPPAPINTGLSDTGVRVDSGLEEGQAVGVYYDPMISKLIVHAETRPLALQMLLQALKQYQIAGVTTNIDFLIQCAQHPVFGRAGAVHTGFLEETQLLTALQEGVPDAALSLPQPWAQAVGALAVTLWLEGRSVETSYRRWSSPWSSHSGSWRMGGAGVRARRRLHLDDDDDAREEGRRFLECTSNRDGSLDVWVATDDHDSPLGAGNPIHVSGTWDRDRGILEAVLDRSRRVSVLCALHEDVDRGWVRVRMWLQDGAVDGAYAGALDVVHPLRPPVGSAAPTARSGVGRGGPVTAPMPGKVTRVNASVGDVVEAGDVVVVMEAMKMEHPVQSLRRGRIAELYCRPGDVVDDGAVLFLVVVEDHNESPTGGGDGDTAATSA